MKPHEWTSSFIRKFKIPSIATEYLRKPFFLKLVGNVKNKKILEIGCGNGYWLRVLAKKGAKCWGVDISRKQIKLARQIEERNRLGIKYSYIDATKLKGIKSNYFDGVILMRVLLEIKSVSKIKRIFKEVNRVLKKGGFIIVSDLHPFAPSLNFKCLIPPKNYSYFKTGTIIKGISEQAGGGKMEYHDIHYTLGDICNSLISANFCIKKIIEPQPSREILKRHPLLKDRKDKPMTIMIKGIKHDR